MPSACARNTVLVTGVVANRMSTYNPVLTSFVLAVLAGIILVIFMMIPQTAPASAPVPVLANAECKMRGLLPDPVCTPGSINPNVTQANIHQTICVSGWTATIRPPTSYTSKLKVEQMKAYGFTDNIADHEEDHLIPLSIGGHPTEPKNLWPQPDAAPNPKDAVESKLKVKVCSGAMPLATAQQRMATDWQTALNQ